MKFKGVLSGARREHESVQVFRARYVTLAGAGAILAGLILVVVSLASRGTYPLESGGAWNFILSGAFMGVGLVVVVIGAAKYRAATRGARRETADGT
ncbi:hypothetical protein ACWEOH_08330 [Agromyces sp. NPDC004153]